MTSRPTARDLRLANLVLEPRTSMSDAGAESKRINSAYGLVQLLRACGELGAVVEIGSFRGVSTEVLLLFAAQVYAVDPWAGMDAIHAQFVARTRGYPHLEIIRETSVDAAARFADHSLDLVYIDGAHDYASVCADLRAWRDKPRAGGWLAGHDYAEIIEGGAVIRAVDEVLGGPHRVFEDSSWLVQC